MTINVYCVFALRSFVDVPCVSFCLASNVPQLLLNTFLAYTGVQWVHNLLLLDSLLQRDDIFPSFAQKTEER